MSVVFFGACKASDDSTDPGDTPPDEVSDGGTKKTKSGATGDDDETMLMLPPTMDNRLPGSEEVELT